MMKVIPLLLCLLFLAFPLLGQELVLVNGTKKKVFRVGQFVEIRSCTACDSLKLNDCVGNYDSFDGKLEAIGRDSLQIRVFRLGQERVKDGVSMNLGKQKFKKEDTYLVSLAKKDLDMIRISSSPGFRALKRTTAFLGCLLILDGLGQISRAWSDPDQDVGEVLQSTTSLQVLVGGLALGQLGRRKFYLSPLLKGSQSKEVWNLL